MVMLLPLLCIFLYRSLMVVRTDQNMYLTYAYSLTYLLHGAESFLRS